MAEPPSRRTGFAPSLRALLSALPPRRRRQLGWLTLLTFANAAADLLFVASAMLFLAALAPGHGGALPWPLSEWLASSGPRGIARAALLFGAGALIANSVRLLYLWRSETYVARVTHELAVEIQRRVFAQPYQYHVRRHGSALVAALEKVETVSFNLFHQWLEGVAALATGVAVLGLLVSVDPLPALAAFAALAILYLGIARLSGRRLAANSARLGPAYDERVRTVQESLGAIRDLIIDHSERAQLAEFRRANERFTSAQASTRVIAAAPRFIVEAGAILLLAALAASLASRGGALVLIGGIAIGGMRVLPLLQTAYRSWANLTANRTVIGDVLELLSLPLPAAGGEVAPLRFKRSLRLEGVSFRYPGRARPALAEITLDIARGQRVALVGETGSGKSTFADLVMGLLTPDAGEILVDETPLDAGNVRGWQRNLAHVSQSLFLADASIARNIAFSVPDEPPDMARVERAAREAEVTDFVESLPDGYDTRVGERGALLSGGQRQRIAIARALYKSTPLLILDEATNALDEATEARVLANLFADRERTILIIAHRPSALILCDQVIRLAEGRIVDA